MTTPSDAPLIRESTNVAEGPRTNRSLVQSAFHLVLGQAATTVLGIVLTGVIGRRLGPTDFGVWYMLNAIVGFAGVFIDWGYSAYVIREVARRPDRTGEITGTILALRSLSTLLVCGPAVLAAWALGSGMEAVWLTALLVITSIPIYLLTSMSWTFRGHERMDFEATVGVIVKVLTVAATALLLFGGLKISGVILGQGLAGASGLAVSFIIYHRLKLPPLRVSIATANELVRGAAPIFTMALMISLQPYIDSNVMARLLPPEVIGWYGAAAALTGTLIAPALILAGTVFPRLSQASQDPLEFRRLIRMSLRPIFFVAVLGAIGTYSFAELAITLVYHSQDFGPTTAVLKAFSPTLLLVSIDVFFGYTILAAGAIRAFARAKLAAVALTTLLEIVLVRYCQARYGNGGIGVMLAFASGELVLICAALRLIPKATLDRGSLIDFLRAIFAGMGALLVVRVTSLPPIAAMPVMIAAYMLFALMVGLITREDVAQLTAVVFRTRRTAVPETAAVVS
jgi:O-antigen/teichoic acid export membrane protein